MTTGNGSTLDETVQEKSGIDRRRFPRWRVDIPVRELRPESHLMRASSISSGGMFVPAAGPRAVGTLLLFEVDIGDGPPLVMAARVVNRGKGDDGFGLGLEFVHPNGTIENLLAEGEAHGVPES